MQCWNRIHAVRADTWIKLTITSHKMFYKHYINLHRKKSQALAKPQFVCTVLLMRMYIIRICILCRCWRQKTQNVSVYFGSWLCWVRLLLVATKMVPERTLATTCWSSTRMHQLRAVKILVMFSSIWELVWRVGLRLALLTLPPMNVVLYMNVCNSRGTEHIYSCTKDITYESIVFTLAILFHDTTNTH